MGTVGVWASVSHGKKTWLGVSVDEVFICKLCTVDRLTTSTVEVGEVTTLQHEVWNDSVEDGVLVTETLFTGTQSSEVLSGLWNVGVKLEGDSA